jgi:hypothetical protein
MQQISRNLRRALFRVHRRQGQTYSYSEPLSRRDEVVDYLSECKGALQKEAVSTLVQMLQAEDPPIRLQLIRVLAPIRGPEATAALARRALFDPSDAVREAAVQALRDRPRDECRKTFLDGLRYPWAPVADHAAEALVALDDRDAVFSLAGLLDKPDPRAPFRNREGRWVQPELVRINHLRNCLLCHAPSFDRKDRVRGLVPEPGKPLREEYYESSQGTFVRADVTYLRQDFSVLQFVADHDRWPSHQRFDYLVRTRELTPRERAALPDASAGDGPGDSRKKGADRVPPPSYPQREAVLFALRELTGEDAGDTAEDWYRFLFWNWEDEL